MLEGMRKSKPCGGVLFLFLLMETLHCRFPAFKKYAFPEGNNKETLGSLTHSVSYNELGSSSNICPDREEREHVQSVLTQLTNEM